MTSRKRQSVLRTRAIVALGAMALIVLAGPALAQSIDLSPVQTLLQGIVDAIAGPLGVVIGTLALIGVFLSWLFGILAFRQALWVVVAIAGIAAAPTIVAAIWTT
ncbi:TrbC/VirB2 family protein [Ruegeria pomeroyi]|nr:TrbC/VirB2 family protein [Ruegeria pomeroyi]